jgi:hypothetical protein
MVKRTAVVLGILALVTMGAGMASAQGFSLGGPGPAQSWVTGFPGGNGCGLPTYCPVPCPEYPLSKTIVKTWSCKIEGPCPPPGPPACGSNCGERPGQLLGSLLYLAGSVATPLDWLFGGFDGVYGCCPGLGGCSGPCGPCYGPVPGVIAAAMGCLSPPPVMFGCYW